MPHIDREYPYEKLPKYPGMRPADVWIWERFIDQAPKMFATVQYDVHIGDPCTDQIAHDAMRASGSFEVSQWCVDVIAIQNKVPWIIEIKPDARAQAIGQVLAYRALLMHEGRVSTNSHMLIITDNASPITKKAAELLDVLIDETGHPDDDLT